MTLSPETKTWDLPVDLALDLGGRLSGVRLAYRTWGTLDSCGANAVVACHALTGNADADEWWAPMFGPGRALDPDRDFIVCSNILGSCYGTTGPATIDPATGQPYGPDFPRVSIRDMVGVQRELLRALGVRHVRCVMGGSLGGMQSLEWAAMYPDLVQSIVPIAVSGRHSAWCIGWSEAQRQSIQADPLYAGGRYDPERPPSAGLAAARMAAMVSYRSRPSFDRRFGRRPQDGTDLFAIESYLRYQGSKLVGRFDANTYVTLTRAMDTHDLARGRGEYAEALASIRVPALVVSVESDVLYPHEEQRELAQGMPRATLLTLYSDEGHDAFLIETDWLNSAIADFRVRVAMGV